MIGWLFVAPATIHLVVFALFPIIYALYLSVFKMQLIRDQRQFVGLGNYAYTFTDPTFWNAMWNSAKYALLSVPLGMILALAVALLVNQRLRGMTIFRTLFYIPAISSGVAIAMLWIYIYLPKAGMVNAALQAVGLPSDTNFLGDIRFALLALVVMSAFVGLGPRMVLFLAGLVNIPQELYEASQLDGASRSRSFWSVTLPMLAPTTFFVMLTSTIGAMQVFTPVYMMTKGGPDDSTDVVGYHIYREAWAQFNTGLASAQSFLLLIIIAAISFLQFRLQSGQLRGYSAS